MGNRISEALALCFGLSTSVSESDRAEPLLGPRYRPHQFSFEAKQLAEAAAIGDYEKVQIILGENTAIHINEADAHGLTSLYNAALHDHVTICNLLLELGADPNIANKNAEVPLHVACKSGNLPLCKMLIRFGADVQFKFRGRSCLDLAVQGNFPDLVSYFLESHPSLLQLQNTLSPNPSTEEMELSSKCAPTSLLIAVTLNHIEIVKLLLEKNLSIGLIDPTTGKTCLMIACEKGYYKMVHLLLARDSQNVISNITQMNDNENGWTCVHYAAIGNAAKCFQVISSFTGENHSIWSEVKDKNGRTPLHLASLYGHYELVHSLLESGVRTDISDNEGNLAQDLASATLHYHHVSKVFREFERQNSQKSPQTIQFIPPVNSGSRTSATLQRAMFHKNSANSSVTVAI